MVRAAGLPSVDILVVTASVQDLRELNWMLAAAAWRPAFAPTLWKARELLRVQVPSVMLTDSHLADGNWSTLCGMLPESSARPLIVVACHPEDRSGWAEALQLGAFDVLAKPLERGEVAYVLGEAWRRRRARSVQSETVPPRAGVERLAS